MKRSNISRADWLLVAATIVAGLRMMLIHAVFIGFDLEAWPWFKAAEVWSGLAFAVLEGVALAYVSRLWVGLRPARAIDWVYWLILAFGMAVMLGSVIGVTSYAASSVREKIGIDALLGSGEAVAWSMFVTALNPLMVIHRLLHCCACSLICCTRIFTTHSNTFCFSRRLLHHTITLHPLPCCTLIHLCRKLH